MIANRCSLHKPRWRYWRHQRAADRGNEVHAPEDRHLSPLRGHPELDFLERLRAGEDAVAEDRTRDAAAISDKLRVRYKLG